MAGLGMMLSLYRGESQTGKRARADAQRARQIRNNPHRSSQSRSRYVEHPGGFLHGSADWPTLTDIRQTTASNAGTGSAGICGRLWIVLPIPDRGRLWHSHWTAERGNADLFHQSGSQRTFVKLFGGWSWLSIRLNWVRRSDRQQHANLWHVTWLGLLARSRDFH